MLLFVEKKYNNCIGIHPLHIFFLHNLATYSRRIGIRCMQNNMSVKSYDKKSHVKFLRPSPKKKKNLEKFSRKMKNASAKFHFNSSLGYKIVLAFSDVWQDASFHNWSALQWTGCSHSTNFWGTDWLLNIPMHSEIIINY